MLSLYRLKGVWCENLGFRLKPLKCLMTSDKNVLERRRWIGGGVRKKVAMVRKEEKQCYENLEGSGRLMFLRVKIREKIVHLVTYTLIFQWLYGGMRAMRLQWVEK